MDVIAIITSLIGLAGVIITTLASNKSIKSEIIASQTATDVKLENLTQSVHEMRKDLTVHNEKIPVIEYRVGQLEKKLEGGNK